MSLTCQSCGKSYDPRPGRGKQSPYCPGCRDRRRRTMTAQRHLRMSVTQINEWVEALAPTIIGWKEDLSTKQEGRCATCGRRRRLFFALNQSEELVLVCSDCHDRWTTERRQNVPIRPAARS